MEIMVMEYPGCPFCRQARAIAAELMKEHPEYAKIAFRYVDETADEKFAASLGYYYTPSYFMDGKKIYEATPHEPADTMRQRLEKLFSGLKASGKL